MASYFCLIGQLLVWHFKVLPIDIPTAVTMSSVLLLPLLLAGPGLFRGKTYTYKWMSLVVWLWLAHGVMETWTHIQTPSLAIIAALEPILALCLFMGLVAFLKTQRRLLTPNAQNSN